MKEPIPKNEILIRARNAIREIGYICGYDENSDCADDWDITRAICYALENAHKPIEPKTRDWLNINIDVRYEMNKEPSTYDLTESIMEFIKSLIQKKSPKDKVKDLFGDDPFTKN